MSTIEKAVLVLILVFCSVVLPANIVVVVAADSAANLDINSPDSSSLTIQLDQLYSRISTLDSKIDESSNELKHKDENIERLENIIQQQSTTADSLKHELHLLQEKGSLDAKYKAVKAYARAGDLGKQVDILKKEMETQTKTKAALESRLSLAEKKLQDLSLKLENLQKINDEQKKILRTTEHALQVAEEEMVKAKLEVVGISKEMRKVHESWIPPWLAVHVVRSQSLVITHWNERGRPALDTAIQKALKKKAQFENWVEPHIDTLRTQGISTMKTWWLAFVTNIDPSVKLLTAKSVDVYHATKKTIEPHVVKLQKNLDPYFMEAEKFSRPYINHISIVMKPHVDKAHVFLKPYMKKVIRGYRKFMKAIPMYHRQVRVTVHEVLKSYDFMKPIATNEFVWYMATALMALPVIILLNLTSAVFSKKPKKRTRHYRSSHARRRPKREHPDK